ncbi:MAG: Rieske (2Fe-2S) protein [Rhodospirillaceae bacterium]|jgi:nitrite reductase/ring-hydroxylating ferredoxin subunit
MSATEICRLDDIPDNNAKGMVAEVEGKKRNIFVARKGDAVFAYLNWCPHNQVLIDQIPGQFYNKDYSLLRCSKHGALFNIDDGMCVQGPCEGKSLTALTTVVKDGGVYLVG